MIGKEYSLNDLAREYSTQFPDDPINVRTLRFYISEGLMEGPGRIGPGKHYSEIHMVLLETIRSMQQAGTSISAIRQLISGLSPEQLLENLAIQEDVLRNKNRSIELSRLSSTDSNQVRPMAMKEESFGEGEQSRCFRIFPGVEIIVKEDLVLEHFGELSEWLNAGESIFSKGAGQ